MTGPYKRFRHDREAYTEAKTAFVERVVSQVGAASVPRD